MAKNQMAFPDWLRDGMSLRDWFAGQALPPCLDMAIKIELAGKGLKKPAPICAAEMAYQVADAMLAERGRK